MKSKSILNKTYPSIEKFLLPLTLDKTFKTIINEGIKLTGAKYGSLFLKNKNGEFEKVYTSLPKKRKISKIYKKGHTYNAFKKGKVKIITREKAILHHPEFKKTAVKFFALVPLLHRNGALGILNFHFYQRKTLSKEKIDILNFFGSLTSLVIKKVQYYDELQTALESRDLFISLASHELKTPLTSANIYAQLIQKKITQKQNIEPQLMNNFMISLKRVTSLIDDFLHIEQIKKGNFHYSFQKQNLITILESLVSDFKLIYPEYRIEFKNNLLEKEAIVIIDSRKIYEAISNLVNNSAKFSKKGSLINISLNLNRKDFIIDVADKGTGIDKKELIKIFDPFYKGTSEKQGMGLGLYLTKDIISHHQGTISATSKINSGTTFRITLPNSKR